METEPKRYWIITAIRKADDGSTVAQVWGDYIYDSEEQALQAVERELERIKEMNWEESELSVQWFYKWEG